jgi:hypothetical protein
MANAVPKEMTFDASKSADQAGACREFWMRFPGLRANSAGGTAADPLYYKENPYGEDLVVLDALAVITTAAGADGDLDVGLADDAAGTNVGAEIFDSIVDSAAGVFEGTKPQAVAGTGAKCIWKAKGSSTDAFLCIVQQADADASAMRWTLLLKVIPYKDLLNSNIELGAIVNA